MAVNFTKPFQPAVPQSSTALITWHRQQQVRIKAQEAQDAATRALSQTTEPPILDDDRAGQIGYSVQSFSEKADEPASETRQIFLPLHQVLGELREEQEETRRSIRGLWEDVEDLKEDIRSFGDEMIYMFEMIECKLIEIEAKLVAGLRLGRNETRPVSIQAKAESAYGTARTETRPGDGSCTCEICVPDRK